jgi:TRAP-type C4-dicarboxylate transport system permease small subunit
VPTLRSLVAWLATALLAAAAVAVMLSMVVGTLDVVGTQLFLSPLHGATEGITELMVMIVFISLAAVQRAGGHIRVELLYARCGRRARAALDAVTAAAALVFFGLLVWQGLDAAAFSWRTAEATMSAVRIPIYPAKIAIVLGVAVAMLALALDLVDGVREACRAAP